jgi:aryl-alcohol dehydrogenase-like predicted oxidoreductase
VRRRNDRGNVILATKGGHPHLANGYPRPERYLAPEVIAQDIAESLERLGIERIDLYFLHRDDPRVPVGEIIDVLNEHISRGHLVEPGASNWTTARLAAANAHAAATAKHGFAANQAKFSLAVAKPSKDPTVPPFDGTEVEWHQSTRLPVWAYTPTAGGYFATNGVKGAGGCEQPASAVRLQRAKQLADELGVTPNQIALAWLLHQDFPGVPILGTTKPEHLHDALGAKGIRLSQDQVQSLIA